MHAGPTGTAIIELDLAGDIPSGKLHALEGASHAFTGWMELAAAIEAWRDEARARHAAGRPNLPPRAGDGIP